MYVIWLLLDDGMHVLMCNAAKLACYPKASQVASPGPETCGVPERDPFSIQCR